MAQPLINGIAYSWSQIAVRALGSVFVGITAIKYDDKQEMQNNWAAGNFPVSRGFGKIEATGSVTLFMEEIESLAIVAPNGRLQEIPEFDVTITFITANNLTVTHTLKNCRFMENSRDMKTGDMVVEKELNLLISHILWK